MAANRLEPLNLKPSRYRKDPWVQCYGGRSCRHPYTLSQGGGQSWINKLLGVAPGEQLNVPIQLPKMEITLDKEAKGTFYAVGGMIAGGVILGNILAQRLK